MAMARSDWPLLALQRAKGERLTPIQMQKILFVFGEQFKATLGEYYEFTPYHYGPFDADVTRDLEYLERKGLVHLVVSSEHPGRDYELTPQGEAAAQTLDTEVNPQQLAFLSDVVSWAQSLSFRQLVTSIYKAFPHMRENSVFR